MELQLEQDATVMDMDSEAIFQMDDTVSDNEPRRSISESLDSSLLLLYKFLQSETHDSNGKLVPEKFMSLYKDIVSVCFIYVCIQY